MILRSPVTGRILAADTPNSLAAQDERWPVVDGIPFLRAGCEQMVVAALDHLDAGRQEDALVTILADQDAWWTGPQTDPGELQHLVRDRDRLSLRQAMALLRLGPVATYFAHRWADPTFLAGLALVGAHWQPPAQAFELACGIGHYLRELTLHGVACTGADVVFAKCWLAKHFVAPRADYVVFDAGFPWPLRDAAFDLVLCQDAFYFLPDPAEAAAGLRALLADKGILAVGHLHNAQFHGGPKGPARPAAEWRALFPAATVYDERDLLASLLAATAPQPTGWTDDPAIEAWSLIEGAGRAQALTGGLAMPHPDAALRPNPLLVNGAPQWPSDRWRDEYAAGCYWALPDGQHGFPPDAARLRRLVSLPERW